MRTVAYLLPGSLKEKTKFFFKRDALHYMFAAWVALNLAPWLDISVQECWLCKVISRLGIAAYYIYERMNSLDTNEFPWHKYKPDLT